MGFSSITSASKYCGYSCCKDKKIFQIFQIFKVQILHLKIIFTSQRDRHAVTRSITSAPIRFLSCEPLLEDLGQLDLQNIDWVIVGGESGPKARPMKEEWALNIQQQTEAHGAAFFFKQWGTWGSDGIKRNKHANGKVLDGKVVQQMPE